MCGYQEEFFYGLCRAVDRYADGGRASAFACTDVLRGDAVLASFMLKSADEAHSVLIPVMVLESLPPSYFKDHLGHGVLHGELHGASEYWYSPLRLWRAAGSSSPWGAE